VKVGTSCWASRQPPSEEPHHQATFLVLRFWLCRRLLRLLLLLLLRSRRRAESEHKCRCYQGHSKSCGREQGPMDNEKEGVRRLGK
jgi:hypothetical protein